MIKSITMNYEGKDFFGQRVLKSDKYEVTSYDSTEKLCKVIDKAMAAVRKGGHYAHFMYDDGSNDCVYLNGDEESEKLVTLKHSRSRNSDDAPVKITAREFKRRAKAAIMER